MILLSYYNFVLVNIYFLKVIIRCCLFMYILVFVMFLFCLYGDIYEIKYLIKVNRNGKMRNRSVIYEKFIFLN